MKTFFAFLLIAIYLAWYGTFESVQLPGKIDSFVHYIRIQNWLEAFKDFDFFRSWHPGPYFGYPEDYNYLLVYWPLAIIGLLISVAWSIKFFFLISFLLAGYGARRFLRSFFESDFQCFLGALFYMGSASLVNFGLGAGSVTRMAGYAFFPWALCFFIKWLRHPDLKSRLTFALIFYASYLVHPVCSVGLVLASLILVLYHKKLPLKEGWLLALTALPLFSWQLGSLLLSRSYISWYNVYDFYRGFLLPVDLTTFLGFWNNTQGRTETFYFGSFPFLLTMASLFLRKRESQLSVLLAGISMLLILSGHYVFKINTYRFDMVFNLGTAMGASILLARLKWKSVAILITFLIIGEQTWYARPFGGESYLDPKKMQALKESINLKSTRQLVSQEWPWIVGRHDVEWISGDYGLHSEGILELSPGNLGILPYVRELQNKPGLFHQLGVSPVNEMVEFKKYLIIHAPTQKISFNAIYRPLLGLKEFDPSRMPLVFKPSDHLELHASDGTTFDLAQDEWKTKVIEFFSGSLGQERSDYSVTPGSLLVIKEPFHPRLSLDNAVMVEPGLIGIYESSSEKIHYRLIWWEIALLIISLIAVLSISASLFFRERLERIR